MAFYSSTVVALLLSSLMAASAETLRLKSVESHLLLHQSVGTTHVADGDVEVDDGLLNEGRRCANRGSRTGHNSFCGTGQCCIHGDWFRGLPGCELAQNQTRRTCGRWAQPRPEPADFRLPPPNGTASTPASPSSSRRSSSPEEAAASPDTLIAGTLMALQAGPEDDQTPEYAGDGGQPWSPYEMVLVRDLLLKEIQSARRGHKKKEGDLDLVGGPKMLRLIFHDCLGSAGCDGCIDWTGVGAELWGTNKRKRMEDREFEDVERKASSNGLETVVEFLEYVYNFDFGMAESCWRRPGTVNGGQLTDLDPIDVGSVEECQQACQNISNCVYFSVYDLGFLQSQGRCLLFGADGELSSEGRGVRLVAGYGKCPSNTPSWSLQSRNKSRADLWAFASLLGVEEGIHRHNLACRGQRRPHGDNVCLQQEGKPGCEIWPSRPFVFQTGRRDCVTKQDRPYKAEETDVNPDEHLNGTMVVSYMEEHFGFSGKETVIIMGAHTLGRFHQEKSGHKYVWTTDWQAFNNQYYRNIAGRDDYFIDNRRCTKVGDAWNNPGHAVWTVKANLVYRSGGPVQWIQKKVVCPNCANKAYNRRRRGREAANADRSCCEENVPEGAFCRPDGTVPVKVNSTIWERDPDFSHGCEWSHFINGRDESALSSDMGLMYRFDVDLQGYPSGCPGLNDIFPSSVFYQSDQRCGFLPGQWGHKPNDWTAEGCPANCAKQDYRYPGDDMTLSEHVERFADDQNVWVEEFIPIMEKMIANGYGQQAGLVASWPRLQHMRGDDVF